MTSIDRARFARGMFDLRLTLAAPAPAAATVLDHTVSGVADYELLYDRLVAMQQAPVPDPARASSLDRATAMYASVLAARSPATSAPAMLASSDYVRVLGASYARSLDAAAEHDVLGPAAASQRRVVAQTEFTAGELRELEDRMARLEPGSAERRAIEERIDATTRHFENTLASERTFLEQRLREAAPRGPLDGLTRGLPEYARRTLEERGLVISTSKRAVVAPRFGAPWGFDLKVKF